MIQKIQLPLHDIFAKQQLHLISCHSILFIFVFFCPGSTGGKYCCLLAFPDYLMIFLDMFLHIQSAHHKYNHCKCDNLHRKEGKCQHLFNTPHLSVNDLTGIGSHVLNHRNSRWITGNTCIRITGKGKQSIEDTCTNS